MRRIVVVIVLFIAADSQAQNQEIQKVVQTFIEAFQTKDTLKVKALCDETMILQSINERMRKALNYLMKNRKHFLNR